MRLSHNVEMQLMLVSCALSMGLFYIDLKDVITAIICGVTFQAVRELAASRSLGRYLSFGQHGFYVHMLWVIIMLSNLSSWQD